MMYDPEDSRDDFRRARDMRTVLTPEQEAAAREEGARLRRQSIADNAGAVDDGRHAAYDAEFAAYFAATGLPESERHTTFVAWSRERSRANPGEVNYSLFDDLFGDD
jgi:hypothetical protein